MIRSRPSRGEGHVDFLGESEGSLPQPHDSLPDAGEARNDFWSISGNFIYRHHVEPREKNHSLFPLKYIDVTRNTDTSLDVLLDENIEGYWNVDGDREVSDAWTGVTRFTVLDEKPLDGFSWSGKRLTKKKQRFSRPDTLWPEIWKDMSDAVQRKEKQKWSMEKPKFDNARRLRSIYFIDPDEEEFKDIMKKARRKLEVPMPAAMLCKIQREKYRETCRVEKNCKTQYDCIVEADEFTRKRMEG